MDRFSRFSRRSCLLTQVKVSDREARALVFPACRTVQWTRQISQIARLSSYKCIPCCLKVNNLPQEPRRKKKSSLALTPLGKRRSFSTLLLNLLFCSLLKIDRSHTYVLLGLFGSQVAPCCSASDLVRMQPRVEGAGLGTFVVDTLELDVAVEVGSD